MAFVPIDCLSIPVSSFDSFLLKRGFSGEFLCLGVCAPPALEYIVYKVMAKHVDHLAKARTSPR